jgi:hypothetical protein
MHGMCVDKLQHVRHFLPRYVDDGKLPGYLCLISRRGEEALFDAHGLMDVARQHLLHDQAGHQRGADDALRARAVSARRSGGPLHPAVA